MPTVRRAPLVFTLALVLHAAPALAAGRALWVWDAVPLLESPAARQTFLAFCRERGITTAWIQASARPGASLNDPIGWQRLLGEAHAAGMRVHALDGAPEQARRSGHAAVLNLVHAVIAFNQAAPAAARFDGIHLDIEPYLLPGWSEPDLREQMLGEYLELQAQVRDVVKSAGGMEFGVDIPFWWQSHDAETGEAIGVVTFRGVRRAASLHLLDLVDTLGIMDYRNVAAGRDGLVTHATELLDHADRTAVKVYVGVETGRDEGTDYWFITGGSRAAYRRALNGTLNRRDVRVVIAGGRVHVGVKATGREVESRLVDLAAVLEVPVLTAEERRQVDQAVRALANEGEWQGMRVDPVVDAAGRAFGAVRARQTMLPKLTFAAQSNEEMDRELGAAEAAFARHRSYLGIAVHHYDSYRARFPDAPPAR